MQIEVVFGDAEKQTLLTCDVPEGSVVGAAILKSGILNVHPGLQLDELQLGIFSKKADLGTILKIGDRVEIYRPLVIDPKEARRLRAIKTTKFS